MDHLRRTVFHDRHIELGAQMVEFGGWHMPVQYSPGILKEHLTTRKSAGLFDISHMGRFLIRGDNALAFLQYSLTNNAAALDVGKSHYTVLPDEAGGAVDDAYLYRFVADEFLLVVNAANTQKDRDHLGALLPRFPGTELIDLTDDIAMISLQGPDSEKLLSTSVESGGLPKPQRNALGIAKIKGIDVMIGRTGYTGEPVCFELFMDAKKGPDIWNHLVESNVQPVGLGARDTLRLEASLPLYGHELGVDPEGKTIPILAGNFSRIAVSFSPLKGDYIGKNALLRQFTALQGILKKDYTRIGDLPRRIMPVALTEKGVPRAGYHIFKEDRHVGYITSGTMTPYWEMAGEGVESRPTEKSHMRAIAFGIIDSTLCVGDTIDVEIREKRVGAIIVPYHLRSGAPPYARPIPYERVFTTDLSGISQ